jgi:hypothetical protein
VAAVGVTLTEFLLAQLGDEAERLVHEFDCDRFEVYDHGCRQGKCDCDATERLLADVEAKRRIVEQARDYIPELEHGDNGEWAFDLVLRLLAVPYADHPDYREEWRP